MLKTSIKELRGCFYPPEDNIEVIENMIKIFL
jgi:hypothetical protein